MDAWQVNLGLVFATCLESNVRQGRQPSSHQARPSGTCGFAEAEAAEAVFLDAWHGDSGLVFVYSIPQK